MICKRQMLCLISLFWKIPAVLSDYNHGSTRSSSLTTEVVCFLTHKRLILESPMYPEHNTHHMKLPPCSGPQTDLLSLVTNLMDHKNWQVVRESYLSEKSKTKFVSTLRSPVSWLPFLKCKHEALRGSGGCLIQHTFWFHTHTHIWRGLKVFRHFAF